MGTRFKKGITLIEVIVSIIIATIVLSAASTTLPRIFGQLRAGDELKQVQDYMKIIADFRNADLDSTVSKVQFKLINNGTTVYYKNETDGLFRDEGDIREKMFFDKLSIYRQPKLSSKEWKLRDEPAKILYYNWWKLNMHKNNKVISGVFKGK